MRGFVTLAARELDDDTNDAERLSLAGHVVAFQAVLGPSESSWTPGKVIDNSHYRSFA